MNMNIEMPDAQTEWIPLTPQIKNRRGKDKGTDETVSMKRREAEVGGKKTNKQPSVVRAVCGTSELTSTAGLRWFGFPDRHEPSLSESEEPRTYSPYFIIKCWLAELDPGREMMANYQEKCCINFHVNADTLHVYFADKQPRVHKKTNTVFPWKIRSMLMRSDNPHHIKLKSKIISSTALSLRALNEI